MDRVIDDTRRWAPLPRFRRCINHLVTAAILLGWMGSTVCAQRPFPGAAPSNGIPSASVPAERPAPPVAQVAGQESERKAALQRLLATEPQTPNSNSIQQVEFDVETLLEDPVVEIVVEGNHTIHTSAVLRMVETRLGRAPSAREIQQDVAKLLRTRWFLDVKPFYRQTAQGLVLVFEVIERPMLRSVQYVGNKKIKTSELEAHTGLRTEMSGYFPAFDVSANREAVQRIKSLYAEKGYRFAKVTLQKGGEKTDRDVVFVIEEGPKVKVRDINFHGNDFVSKAILTTKISTKTPVDDLELGPLDIGMGWIGGDYDPDVVRNDVYALKQYYLGLGFFDVDVTVDETISETDGKVTVDFHVSEGQRYVVGDIQVIGNGVINRDALIGDLELESGDHFNSRFLRKDVTAMKDMYDERGHVFAKVEPVPHFRENEPGVVDLTYQIDEDIPRYIGAINIHIRGDHPHTQEHVVRDQVHRFLKPGTLASGRDLRMAQQRVQGSPIWERTEPAVFDLVPVDGLDYLPEVTSRGQSDSTLTPETLFADHSEKDFTVDREHWWQGEQQHVGRIQLPDSVFEDDEEQIQPEVPINRKLRETNESSYVVSPDVIFRGQDEPIIRAQHLDQYGNPIPQDYISGGVSPQGDPFGDALRSPPAPGFVDVNIDVTEGRTGRLMFGVGVNSDAGVVGSLTLQEDNFDILRFPRSWSDIANGQAFRGAGQSFRLEAVPGSQVSRYLASWTDPFFMGTDFSLGLSGFYYNRFYDDWTEDRLGGRISLGYVLNRFWTASTAVRLENVKVRDINSGIGPIPPDLEAVRGDNFLSTVSGTLEYDTRDNAFIPSTGHNVTMSYEQGFGDFSYPRIDLSGSQYLTIYERPDGFGKHIVSFSGQVAWTGDDTPIFERYYAGGYSSFRGFEFRGVTPREGNFEVGGEFMALGSAQYEFPISASDSIRGVVFSDFGTVEEDVSLDQFRVTAGFGARVVVPAMGPAPLAFDFAWPIMKQDFDETRVFSFTVGFTR
ncbi:BamA/TamA family outer membrane protein [Thalassoglobus sp. JC818]|uniref:BamA/OMP85 family outer membrane protein n=1 Tax=Thalassoglobus sp. JC818 TaxID=3232136 RepID=UPI0034598FBA